MMHRRDPKLIALQFNEFINEQNVEGLSSLMTEDHTFVDRHGEVDQGKESMTRGWKLFFKQFPEYRNDFSRVESRANFGDPRRLCRVVGGRATRSRYLDSKNQK
jgi:ketosteroid isomerase-like protein